MNVTRVLVVGEPLHEIIGEERGGGSRGFGGDALNVAVYLAREAPALRVGLGAAVGDDSPTSSMMKALVAEGLDLSCVRRVPGTRTGLYSVATDDSGERSFTYRRRDSPFRIPKIASQAEDHTAGVGGPLCACAGR